MTSGDGHTAYWYVATYDTHARHARYVRVKPEANAGNVDLEESFSESRYSVMMEHWRRAISDRRGRIDERRPGVRSSRTTVRRRSAAGE